MTDDGMRGAFTEEGEFAFPSWSYAAEDAAKERERNRQKLLNEIRAKREAIRRAYEQAWDAFWQTEQDDSDGYSHLLLIRMPNAWKMRTKALVGSKVAPNNYVRFARANRDWRIRRSGYDFGDCTVIRLNSTQAMMAKLSMDGEGRIIPFERKVLRKWPSLKRTELKLLHDQAFEQTDYDNLCWAAERLP